MKTIIIAILLVGCISNHKVTNVKKEPNPTDLGLTVKMYIKINDSIYRANLNDLDVIFYSKNDSININSCIFNNKALFDDNIKKNPFEFRQYLYNIISSYLKENKGALTKKLKENTK